MNRLSFLHARLSPKYLWGKNRPRTWLTDWFDWVAARMAVRLTGLIEWLPGWLSSWSVWLSGCKDGCQICGGTAKPFNMRWNRQKWTLSSIEYAVGPPEMDIEVHSIRGGTARNGHWDPILGCWDRQYGHWGPKYGLEQFENEFWGPKIDFWEVFQDQNQF